MKNVHNVLHERFKLQNEYLGEEKIVNKITPLVSVVVATYRHARFIAQCLDGIVNQVTKFPIEVIVGEDGSDDGTTELCIQYAEKYPNLIRLFIRDRSLSQYRSAEGNVIRFNGVWNRMSARGKYIAMCEGDDYWIDPLKLQKQVDFLEANPKYVLSHTNFRYYFELDKKYFENKHCASNLEILSKGLIPEDILHRYFVQTLTAVMRRDAYQKAIQHDEFLFSGYFLMGDTQLWYELSKLGKIHFLTDVTGVYRKNEGSATRGNIKNSYRFELSSAELRQYLCERDNLSPSFCKKTQIRYNRALYNYKVFDQTFIPKFENTDEGIRMFILLNAIFLLRPVLIIMVKLRAHIGYVKRLILG